MAPVRAPKPLPIAIPQAPVSTANRYEPLSEIAVVKDDIFEEIIYLKTEKMFCTDALPRRSRPSKKRRGKMGSISSSATSSITPSSKRAAKIINMSLKQLSRKVIYMSIEQLSRKEAAKNRPGGYEHPWPRRPVRT